jgi:putative transposase
MSRHRLSGHLFQGRYKALLIDPESSEYGRVVADYIHLNPVRAGIVKNEKELAEYSWCSYGHYASGKGSPAWLRSATIYGDHGLRSERAADRRRLRQYMSGRIGEELERGARRIGASGESPWAAIRRGWVLGSEAFRERMEYLVSARVQRRKRESYAGEGLRRHDQRHAESLLEGALERLGVGIDQMRAMRKNELRKQATAWLLKSRTAVGNRWICETLRMRDRSNVNRAMRRIELADDRQTRRVKTLLHQCPD